MFSFLVGPLALALGLPLAVAALDGWLDWRRERRLAAAGLLPMDRVDRLAFMRWLADFVCTRAEPLTRRLYGARGRANHGPDAALFRDDTPAIILARRWRGAAGVRAVLRAVLEVLATKAVHRADGAIGRFVTTSRATMRTATALARANGTALRAHRILHAHHGRRTHRVLRDRRTHRVLPDFGDLRSLRDRQCCLTDARNPRPAAPR